MSSRHYGQLEQLCRAIPTRITYRGYSSEQSITKSTRPGLRGFWQRLHQNLAWYCITPAAAIEYAIQSQQPAISQRVVAYYVKVGLNAVGGYTLESSVLVERCYLTRSLPYHYASCMECFGTIFLPRCGPASSCNSREVQSGVFQPVAAQLNAVLSDGVDGSPYCEMLARLAQARAATDAVAVAALRKAAVASRPTDVIFGVRVLHKRPGASQLTTPYCIPASATRSAKGKVY